MKALIQRVTEASVTVEQQVVGSIKNGLLVLIGIGHQDTHATSQQLVEKILKYRVFSDPCDKMNLSLQQISGGLLLVPQFTLMANTNSGLRPSFSNAAPPTDAKILFEQLVNHAKSIYPFVSSGQFGADMQVSLVNSGPVTFLLEA